MEAPRREGLTPNRARKVHVAFRETVFLSICLVGAWLFLHHDLLYLRGDVQPAPISPESLLLSALVLYAFVRATCLVAGLRLSRPAGAPNRCPECGQVLDDGTPEGARFVPRIEHGRSTLAFATFPVAIVRPVGSHSASRSGGPQIPGTAAVPASIPVENALRIHSGGRKVQNPEIRRITKVPWMPKNLR